MKRTFLILILVVSTISSYAFFKEGALKLEPVPMPEKEISLPLETVFEEKSVAEVAEAEPVTEALEESTAEPAAVVEEAVAEPVTEVLEEPMAEPAEVAEEKPVVEEAAVEPVKEDLEEPVAEPATVVEDTREKIVLLPFENLSKESNAAIKIMPELKQLLSDRGLHVIDEELLTIISQIVVDHENMRHGIEILRKSGLFCDKEGLDRVTADIVREAANEVYPTFRGDVIDQLKDQELLALNGITKSLINKGEAFTLVDDAFVEYEANCEAYSIPPHVKMSFRKYVRQLTQLKIIASKTVRIEEATRGRHLEITLLDIPAVKLIELLDDVLEKKFGK